MNKISEWLKSKNITSHSIAVVALAIFGFYVSDQTFQSFINGLFAGHPKVLGVLSMLVVWYLKYSHSSK